jgi:hypothetical protein
LFLVFLLLASCATDDHLPPTAAPGVALTLHVTAGGFADTRAQESDYTTIFENGDQIGVSIEANRTLVADNVPFTYNDGAWTSATTLTYHRNATYFASYPYNAANGGKLAEEAVITGFAPTPDQSTLARYQANDLMTATGSLNGTTLTFNLAHRMALVEVEIPYQNYQVGESSKYLPSGTPTFAVGDAIGGATGIIPYFVEHLLTDGTSTGALYRCIVTPHRSSEAQISGAYNTFDEVPVTFKQTADSLPGSKYYRLKVIDKGAATPIATTTYTLVYDAATLKAAVSFEGRNKYKLMNDIDLQNASDLDPADNYDSDFDGCGYTVSNINCRVGLFGGMISGTIKNLTIGGSNRVTGDGGCFGHTNDGIIDNCFFNGTFANETNNGRAGIVYYNRGEIWNCANSGTIASTANRGYLYIGGICAQNYGFIIACKNSGTVQGPNGVPAGGICGYNADYITSCYNTGSISGTGTIGGIAGINAAVGIFYSYNIGAISGTEGSAFGAVVGSIGNRSIITDCYYSDLIENGTNATGTQQFSSTAWPAASAATEWSLYDGWILYDGTDGDWDCTGYDWKSLGSWNGGTPDYPTLWWEE